MSKFINITQWIPVDLFIFILWSRHFYCNELIIIINDSVTESLRRSSSKYQLLARSVVTLPEITLILEQEGPPKPPYPSRPSKAKVWVKGLTARLLRLHLGPWIKHQLGRRAPCLRAWGTRNWGQLTHAQSIQILLCSQLRGHITEGDQKGCKGWWKRLCWFDSHTGTVCMK